MVLRCEKRPGHRLHINMLGRSIHHALPWLFHSDALPMCFGFCWDFQCDPIFLFRLWLAILLWNENVEFPLMAAFPLNGNRGRAHICYLYGSRLNEYE